MTQTIPEQRYQLPSVWWQQVPANGSLALKGF